MKHIKNTIFYSSLKNIKPDIIHTMLLDLISIFIFFIIAGSYYYVYGNISDRIALEFSFVYVVYYVLITIVALILIALNSAYFRYLVYRINIKQKSSFKKHLKFSFFWVLPWTILFILLFANSTNSFIIVFLGLIYLFLTTIARNQMSDFSNSKNKKSHSNSFKLILKKMFEIVFMIHKFILHYIVMLLFLVFLVIIVGLTYTINENLFYFLFVASILFFMSWGRIYVNMVVINLKR